MCLISGCSSSDSKQKIVGLPIPFDKASLKEVRYETEELSFAYKRGYSMPMVNTQRTDQAYVGAEPLAYIDTCKNKTPLVPGELRFQQYAYKARWQDGNSHKLECELMPVSEVWLDTFLDALPICLQQGLEKIEWEKPESIVVHSVMIYMHKGRGVRLSLHAPARAVDLSKLELVYKEENRELVVAEANKKNNPTDKEEVTIERKFYEAFRQCWSDQLVEKHGCNQWSSSYRGSVGWEDGAHQKHIHLSRPFCPKNSNYYGG